MPRLSDLLSDKLKNRLLTEPRKLPPKQEAPDRPLRSRSVHPPAANTTEPHQAVKPKPLPLPDFVAIDVETTGLNFSSDRIIEIGAVKFIGGKPAEGQEFSSFVNPGVPIPAIITDLTGITDADVVNAPKFSDIAEKLLSFTGGLPLCGHQITFDLTFLNKELERAGKQGMQPIGRQSLDTVLLSKIILQSSGTRFSLKSVSDKLEVVLDDAHRALADAKASGEVAAILIPKIAELPRHVRQTMAAAAPASFLKQLIFKSLGNAPPKVSVRSPSAHLPAGADSGAPKLAVPEKYRAIDTGAVKSIFSRDGSLDREMPSFTLRTSQRSMAIQVAEAFNTQSILLAEAGTGTGKSLAYLVPASLWALENNTRVVVATRTRNLQDQLMSKELPLVAKIAGRSGLRYSVLKGRGNYICISRWQRLLLGEAGNLSIRERFALLPLIPWVESTATGDIEEQNQFNPKWFSKVWDLISADSHGGCDGRRCPFFRGCFLQQARQKAVSSHIVIINHALFFSEMGGTGSFLGKIDSIIFDEAHHLESGGHRHLRVELDTNRIALFLEELNNLVQSLGIVKENALLAGHGGTLKSHLKRLRKHATAFLNSVQDWAKTKTAGTGQWAEYQIPVKAGDFSSNVEAMAFANTLETLKDLLHQLRQDLPSASLPAGMIDIAKEEVPACQERASQLSADLDYCVAAQTEDHAFWVEGNLEKGWTKLCGVPLDVAGLLSGIWAECGGAIVFTSATLSVARSAEYFFNSVGLEPHKARTVTGFFPSPFTKDQAIMGAIKNAPDPDSAEFPAYAASAVAELHVSLNKNILVLFTANAMLGEVYKRLKADTRLHSGQNILAQNISGGRHLLLEQFKQNQRMILLGTDSFWEGIDVPGEACEIVVITRLPFPVPSHPLYLAIAEKMARLHGESFMSYAVPEAVIRFRQGCGRLIRTATDRGALVVLDNRIVTRGYGKQFVRSLEAPFNAFDDTSAMLGRVREFFSRREVSAAPSAGVTYIPFDEV